MKELTAKQQALWDLQRPVVEGGQAKSYAEIAELLGISIPVVGKTLNVVRRKLGIDNAKERHIEAQKLEVTTPPETQAAVLDALSDPINKLKHAFAEAGLPEKVNERLIHRLRVKYSGVITEARNLKTQEILDLLGTKIHLGLQYLDDKVMAEASARDLMLGLGVMVEKRQLLRGEPTQIISDHDRKKLTELTPLLIAEAQRRGITLEGRVIEKHVEPANAA